MFMTIIPFRSSVSLAPKVPVVLFFSDDRAIGVKSDLPNSENGTHWYGLRPNDHYFPANPINSINRHYRQPLTINRWWIKFVFPFALGIKILKTCFLHPLDGCVLGTVPYPSSAQTQDK
jgi:hypothetical protein